jgi:uncharacterized protein
MPSRLFATLSSRTGSRNDVRRRTITTALVAAVLVAAGCRLVILDTLIFFPDRTSSPPPAGVEERTFTAADGTRLAAFHAPAPDGTAPVLVWSHGNAGNVSNRADVLVALADRGLGVLAFDYRGYGRSEGRPSEEGVYVDAEAAYDLLRSDGVPAERIVAFGESIGGAVAIELARRRPCAALVVLSTFTTLNEVARIHYGPLAALLSTRFPSIDRIAALAIPLLVLHGDRDEIVPFALGRGLFAAAREPKRFVVVPGASHNDVFDRRDVLDAIAAFAREAVARGDRPS